MPAYDAAMPLETAGADRPVSRSAGSTCVGAARLPAWWPRVGWVVAALSLAWTADAMIVRQGIQLNQLDLRVYLMGAEHVTDPGLYSLTLHYSIYHLPFTYPPFAAIVFFPLALVSEHTAQVIVSTINLGCLVALIVLAIRMCVPSMDARRRLMVALALSYPAYLLEPVSLTNSFGQVNLVLAVLVWMDLGRPLHVRGRAVSQGYMLGIAAAVKLVPLVYVLYLLVVRRVRLAVTAIATFAGCIFLGFAVNPHGSWQYWTKYVDDSSRIGNVFFISNQSLFGALDRFAGRQLPAAPIDVLAAIIMGLGLLLAARVGREDALLGLVVVSATGDLVSPITWVHHLVWVVPLLVWMIFAPARPRFGRWWSFAVFAVMWWSPVFRVPNGGRRELSLNGWQQVLGNAYFFMMVALLALVAFWVVRRGIGRSPRTHGSPAHGNTAQEVNSSAVIATNASAETTTKNA